VDADPAEILPVFGVVRGVRVPPGAHLVEMYYRPPGLTVGMVLSFAGLLACGASITWGGGRGNLVKSPRVS
jgi:uncharacterized membrane protein YfhO